MNRSRSHSCLAGSAVVAVCLGWITSPCEAHSVWIDALFAYPALQQIAVNPSGTLIAAHGFRDDTHALLVQAVDTGRIETVYRSRAETLYWWEDDDTLIVRDGDDAYVAVELDSTGGRAKERALLVPGHLIDALPLLPDRVLWGHVTSSDSSAYQVSITALLAGDYEKRHRVAHVPGQAWHWVSDREGVPMAVLTRGGEGSRDRAFHLLHRSDPKSSWQEVGSWDRIDDVPTPVGIAVNGYDLLVVSGKGRNTAALREFRVDDGELGAVIYENAAFDVIDVVFGYEGSELLAVVFEEDGVRRYHYLDPLDTAQHATLDRLFPGKVIHVTGQTRDRRFLTVWVSDSRDPGHYYFVNPRSGRTVDIGAVSPRIDPASMAPVNVIKLSASDGQAIEAFLALPVRFNGKRPPLVVMPHGGPIGVSDRRAFDPVVQALATGGYAVLQVNYRGSGGKGASFLEAGKRAWGRGIEDDIEAALDRVLASSRVDPERICIFGASYGGYSALISTTRRPQRYRCAVASAAPTDLLLMFQSSDFASTEEGRKNFAEIVGDPERDREHLIGISPAYRAQDMEVPILLIHGDRDVRVDVEHAYRMKAMLEAYGRAPQWMLIQEAVHDLTRRQWIRLMERVLEFLDTHLALPADRKE
jgi:dipeptidyl aminopeptidase/acylaminoacyl peptidase